MDKIAQIQALKRLQTEVDEMSSRIEDIVNANEIAITENVDDICLRIENELEEIYELTDERVHDSRHFYFMAGGHSYGLAFDGKQNKMYFLDSEKSWGREGDDQAYHIVISKYPDASGTHYYEDGKWRDQRTKEIFASEWETIKEGIKDKIIQAYERYQKKTLENNMRKLQESEKRLASVTN